MCNPFVLSLVPTIICVCPSGTGIFSGDHGGVFLLVGYNLVVWARAAFLMYPCGSGLFGVCVCFGGNDFLGLIISFLVFLWDFMVEVGFGGGGACPF